MNQLEFIAKANTLNARLIIALVRGVGINQQMANPNYPPYSMEDALSVKEIYGEVVEDTLTAIQKLEEVVAKQESRTRTRNN